MKLSFFAVDPPPDAPEPSADLRAVVDALPSVSDAPAELRAAIEAARQAAGERTEDE